MSKYTMELRQLQAEFYEVMQEYPIFDESYREILNDKIYHACKMREIGFETPELFLEQLKYWMDLHMPEYNWLYKGNLVVLTPLQRTQIMESMNRIKNYNEQRDVSENTSTVKDYTSSLESDMVNSNISTSNTNESNSSESDSKESNVSNSISNDTMNSKSYHSDFPQANLSDTEDSNYYTTGEKGNTENQNNTNENSENLSNDKTVEERESNQNNTSNSTQNSQSINNIDDTTTLNGKTDDDKVGEERETEMKSKITGANYSDFELLEQYRKAFVNVDNKLIKALKKDLFMNIW